MESILALIFVAIAVVVLIAGISIVVHTTQQTELQQEMGSLLREIRRLLQKIADREGSDDNA